jgi:asparagine synthase (glutamine-hydrolysing)
MRVWGSSSFEEFLQRYFTQWNRLLPGIPRREIFRPIWSEVADYPTFDVFREVFSGRDRQDVAPSDLVNHCQYFEAKTFLHGLLVVEDKLSMTHSLESRLPFLDNDVVDFAQACPVKFKLSNPLIARAAGAPSPSTVGTDESDVRLDGKQILRTVMSRHLPPTIGQYRKQGFSAPDASWFRGPSSYLIRDRLLHRDAVPYQFLDFNVIQPLLTEHLSGRANHRLLIWSLLTVNELMS